MLLRTIKIFGKPKIQRETFFWEGGGEILNSINYDLYAPINSAFYQHAKLQADACPQDVLFSKSAAIVPQ